MAAQPPPSGTADVPATDWLTGGYGPPPPPFGSYNHRESVAPTYHNLGPGSPRPDLWEHTTPQAAAIQSDAAEQKGRSGYEVRNFGNIPRTWMHRSDNSGELGSSHVYQPPLLATNFYNPPPIAQLQSPEERVPDAVEAARAQFLANAAAHRQKPLPMIER